MTSSNDFKVAAILNVYNDADFLERTLESLKEKVDPELIIIADGAYEKFPHTWAQSTDGTYNIAKKEADIFMKCGMDSPWKGEANKRNALLSAVPQGWWALRIDGDEEIEKFDLSQLDRDEDVIIAKMKNYKAPDEIDTERQRSVIFRPEHDWYYKEKDALFKGSKSIAQLKRVSTERIVYGHHPYARPDERIDKRMEYRDRIDQHSKDPRER